MSTGPDAAHLGRAPFQVIQRALISAPLVGRFRYIKILWGISDCRVSYIRQSHIEEDPMSPSTHHIAARRTALQHPDLTLDAALELSRATWLVTALAPGSDRMSKHSTAGGDGSALLGLLERT